MVGSLKLLEVKSMPAATAGQHSVLSAFRHIPSCYQLPLTDFAFDLHQPHYSARASCKLVLEKYEMNECLLLKEAIQSM